MRTFKQLTQRDRVMISRLRACGISISQIAIKLGKNKSSISRELKRNAYSYWEGENCGWKAETAQRIRDFRSWKANQLRRRKKVETKRWVIEKLKAHWSPEQISGRSKFEGPEPISHECIYQMIIDDKKCGGGLYRTLKRFNKRRSRFGSRVYEPTDRPSIRRRPKLVDKLKRIGDLEADLVQGFKADGYVLTVLDRKSQMVILRKLKSKHMNKVTKALNVAIKRFKVVHTLTVDNGKEFLGYRDVEKVLKIEVFFSDPYCSTQRARVENMNGLIRYYLPKKMSFKNLTQSSLNEIANQLNNRPRKTLKFLTPKEAYNRFLHSN